MNTIQKHNDEDELIQLLNTYHQAMEQANVDALDDLLTKDYSLTHITGYEQPKQEWFHVIQSRRFDYHRIDIDKQRLSIDFNNERAVINGRGIFNATIYGMNNPWQLQFTMQLEKENEGIWKIKHAHYSTY